MGWILVNRGGNLGGNRGTNPGIDSSCSLLEKRASTVLSSLCLARWCNWLTRRPLKAESTGSSPVRAISLLNPSQAVSKVRGLTLIPSLVSRKERILSQIGNCGKPRRARLKINFPIVDGLGSLADLHPALPTAHTVPPATGAVNS